MKKMVSLLLVTSTLAITGCFGGVSGGIGGGIGGGVGHCHSHSSNC